MGLFDDNAGTNEISKGIAALQAVNVPNASQLSLPELQKYVQAGVLTPQQYQAISEDPNTYKQAAQQAQDSSGTNAQKSALQQLSGISQAGGSSPINQANLLNNIQQTNQAMQADRGGIEQNAQERGVAGGGMEFLQKLMNEQNNSQNANTGAVNAAANNAQLGLNAIAQQGQLGGQLQGEANTMTQAQANAANNIGQYNSQLQSMANQYNTQSANQAQQMNLANAQNISGQNTGLANERTQYNAGVPQTVFNDQMQKAGGIANAYGQQGQMAQQSQNQQNQMTGQLIGTGATVLGGMYGGPAGAAAAGAGANALTGTNAVNSGYGSTPTGQNANRSQYGLAMGGEVKCYAEGGEVHDHSLCMAVGGEAPSAPPDSSDPGQTPLDSAQKDTVPAMLQPHEIVLPTSVTQSSDPSGNAANFVSQIKGGGAPPGAAPTAGSFKDVLALLEQNGLELRLSSAGGPNAGI